MPSPVEFSEIEPHKENIAPSTSGHSAASLAKVFSVDAAESRPGQAAKRQEFEKQIAESGELDDPIEPYLEYIKWTNDEFPQGHNAESGLLQLLERCTSEFRDASFYKDDSRYLKVWMQYIKYSDAPKEIFTYLARKEIGKHLATFYEEYAAYLESSGRKRQADEVFQLGITCNARPVERLKRRYNEFLERMTANPPSQDEPSSPAMPTVRPALATKSEADEPLGDNEEGGSYKPSKKMQIFQDGPESQGQEGKSTGGWDSIGSFESRRKENVMAAQPWVGEKLSISGNSGSQKSLSVFKDPVPGQPAAGAKRSENIAVAMEFLYDENNEEYCFEEVLARSRRILETTYPKPNGATMTMPLKGDSPAKTPRSPTMTMHTKAATEEVYEMFNQPLEEDDGNDSDAYSEGNYTDYTETTTSRVDNNSGMNNINELNLKTQELSVNDNEQVFDQEEEEDGSDIPPATPATSRNLPYFPMMTPIVETTETNLTTSTHKGTQYPLGNISPLVDLKTFNPLEEEVRIKILSSLDPPLNSYQSYFHFKDQVFGKEPVLKKALKRTGGNSEKSKSPMVIKFPSTGGSSDGGLLFCMHQLLGEGSFGSVYLAETENGQLKAIKIQTFVAAWEYYILKNVQSRLKHSRSLRSVVTSDALFVFDDESYMIMDFFSQGTILDLVNHTHSKITDGTTSGLGEPMATFFAIELLRTVESLHSCGIIHGDIKPDNVMLRLDHIQDHEWSKYYDRNGANGWSNKGIVLIDFGRAVDMSVLRPDVEFTADWEMDEEDCKEMQRGQPWTYQTDYHGIASVIHLMLFGKVIKAVQESDGSSSIRLANNFKRYWHKEVWEELFANLLNSASQNLPIVDNLRVSREKLESRLEEICESNGNSLRSSLMVVENEIGSIKKRL